MSHAPCLHFAIPDALINRQNEEYHKNVRAIRRSIEVCHVLDIPRIVIHACVDQSFDEETFYRYNKMFYEEFLDLAEKYNVMILSENWDNDASLFSTGEKMRKFLDYMGHPLLSACWDTAHGNIAEGARKIGQYENIIALGDKLKGLHISDNFGDVHHHSWPFAGIINFDEIMQGLIDVNFDWYFNFEASYTLLHHKNMPYNRKGWEHQGKTVEKLLDPPIHIKQKAVDLLYDVGQHILETYGIYEK
jgi:sugar phosphate isomerase/epimerase